MEETAVSRQKRYTASKTQNLLKEYGDLIIQVVAETIKEYEVPINDTTAEGIGLAYTKQKSAKDALNLFVKKLHGKANERT